MHVEDAQNAERAVWSTAFVNSLPDSSFLYIAPGGSKDSEGKTTPRSLRFFPYKDASGKVDLPHLRNAIARIPQSSLPAAVKDRVQAKARRILENQNRSQVLADKQGVETYNGDVFRAVSTPEFVIRGEAGEGSLGTMAGTFSIFDAWTEIDSAFEGHFLERIARTAFNKTIRESADKIRAIFHHGLDPNIGVKVLGPIEELRARQHGIDYAVRLLDTDYNRSLLPGLQENLYGASFRARVVKKDGPVDPPKRSDWNPGKLPEVTLTELALKEFGPTPFPAYEGTSASMRSATDEMLFMGLIRDPSKLREVLYAERAVALDDDEEPVEATPDDESRSTREPEAETRKEDEPEWLLRR